MLPLSICSFLSTLAIGPLFDRIGRKMMLLITCTDKLILDSATGIIVILTQLIASSAPILLIMTCFMFIFGSPAASAANLIASEIFPTATRPIVLSLIFMLGMLGGMCGIWIDNHYITGVLMLLSGITGWRLCPAAEGKSL